MLNLIVIRHGITNNNINGIITGSDNPQLSLLGKKQVAEILPNLPKKVHKIYSSPLYRCIETAKIINLKYHINISEDKRLNERSFGSIQGKKWDEIDPRGDLREIDLNFKFDYSPYGGESAKVVLDRVKNFIEDIKSNNVEKNVVVVTSSGIIKSFYLILQSKIVKSVKNGSYHYFKIDSKIL